MFDSQRHPLTWPLIIWVIMSKISAFFYLKKSWTVLIFFYFLKSIYAQDSIYKPQLERMSFPRETWYLIHSWKTPLDKWRVMWNTRNQVLNIKTKTQRKIKTMQGYTHRMRLSRWLDDPKIKLGLRPWMLSTYLVKKESNKQYKFPNSRLWSLILCG